MSKPFFLLLALIAWLMPAAAGAASGPWQQDDAAAVRLISATETVGEQGTIDLGLDIQMADGWHTYWRTPGDAGLPPALDWTGSENFKNATLLYPLPERIDENGLQTLGYRGRIVLPLKIQMEHPNHPLKLALKLDLLACGEMCVPKSYTLKLNLPAGPAQAGYEAKPIEAALARVPAIEGASDIRLSEITVTGSNLSLTAQSETKMTAPDLILEAANGTAIAPQSTALSLDGKTVTFRAKLDSTLAEKATGDGLSLTATIIDGDRAGEYAIKATNTTPPAIKLLGFLCLALLGGFILNLMPCVLPVLSLKVLGLVRHGGCSVQDCTPVRHSFLATAGGIVFSFLILAAATIALKLSGQAFGWGVQFQQPVFLVFLIAVLTLFACNLLGFFEITLPRFLMDSMDPVRHPRLAGDFATGAMATLLATPCTAPFLGTSVAFALTAGSVEIVLIFLALGLGMALPYFLIALRPSLASRLPKPGNWILNLTRLLGLGLVCTVAWLLFILRAEIGGHAALTIAGLVVMAALFLIARHRSLWSRFSLPATILLLLCALMAAYLTSTPESVRKDESGWARYNEADLEQKLREGKTIYLDVTADWCLTCKVNKRVTLARGEVRDLLFRTPDLIPMRADWTNPDPAILKLLGQHNRYGIPFTVVYGPSAPQGIVLPELLFAADIFAAVDKARAPRTTCPVDLPAGRGC